MLPHILFSPPGPKSGMRSISVASDLLFIFYCSAGGEGSGSVREDQGTVQGSNSSCFCAREACGRQNPNTHPTWHGHMACILLISFGVQALC